MSDIAVRPVQPGDVDVLLELVKACDETYRAFAPPGWEPPDPDTAHWVTELGASDRWTQVAVEPDGRVVGFVSWNAAREGPQWRTVPGLAHVGALFVHPDRWRRGIARRLLTEAMEEMRAHGFERARLNTPDGAPAERFYTALGWRRDGRARFHEVVRLHSVGYSIEL